MRAPSSQARPYLYEIDVNWYGIAALKTLGLAWDIKMPKLQPASEQQDFPAACGVPDPQVEEEALVFRD